MKTIQICLPKAAEWDAAENYAENLRMSAAACVPVGLPQIIVNNAGEYTTALNGHILTVGTDRRTLYIDGMSAGTLSGNFLSALANGENTLIFTDNGTEWLSGSQLQGSAPGVTDVEISTVASSQLSTEVIPPDKLSGTYTRTSEALQAADCRAMVSPVASALEKLSVSARVRGLLTQPAWVSWRMLDIDGRTIATGTPERIGTLQGASLLTFSASKTDSTVQISGTATLTIQTFGLTLKVGRSTSEFWRKRIRSIEIILWPDCVKVSGATGHINIPTLSVTPRIEETERIGEGIIAARMDFPFEGINSTISIGNFGDYTTAELEDLKVTASHCAGTINAYALSDQTGVLAIASAADPLSVTVMARICRGKIIRICSPAGGGGGWNYGRHHLLVFASDGVYTVSVDGAMTKISSTPICTEGIARFDAVSIAADAIYMASATGYLLKIKGARVERVPLPVSVSAICWSAIFGELLMWGNDAKLYALSDSGELSVRSIIGVRRFVEPDMVVDRNGALRSLSIESNGTTLVQWRRRVSVTETDLERHVEWFIDAENTFALKLSILLDSGNSPQRALELEINGPINAPITGVFRAPVRPYMSAAIGGLIIGSARLKSIGVGAVKQYPRGVLHRCGRRRGW